MLEPYLTVFERFDMTFIHLILDKAPVQTSTAVPDKAQKPTAAPAVTTAVTQAVTTAAPQPAPVSPSPAKPGAAAGALMSKALAGFGGGAKKVAPPVTPAPAAPVPQQGPSQTTAPESSKVNNLDKGSFG